MTGMRACSILFESLIDKHLNSLMFRVADSYALDCDDMDSFIMEDGFTLHSSPSRRSQEGRGGSAGGSSLASPTSESLMSGGSERLSTMVLLHGALSALSLTDKCALSLSLGGSGTDSRPALSDDFEVITDCICNDNVI